MTQNPIHQQIVTVAERLNPSAPGCSYYVTETPTACTLMYAGTVQNYVMAQHDSPSRLLATLQGLIK